MSYQASLLDLPNVISSPGSAGGHLPCDNPDGLTTDQCGQEVALANLSARQAKEQGLLTSGTYGLHSSISSKSAALSSSLASKLRARTQILGSTLYKLTWSKWVTPSGVCRLRQRGSAHRKSGKGLIGWPTPLLADSKGSAGAEERKNAELPNAEKLAGWPTPRAAESGPDYAITDRLESGGYSLQTVAAMAGWTTPSATDGDRGGTGITEGMSGTSLTQALTDDRLADANRQHGNSGGPGSSNDSREREQPSDISGSEGAIFRPSPTNGHWRDVDWLFCRDGKWRPVEPGTFPLASGISSRVGLLRGYGNSISPAQASEFIKAYMELQLN